MSTKKVIGLSFATQYLELVIQFIAVLVLARLLSPEEIGAYSVATFLTMLLHVFRDFGVVQYIIQEHDLTKDKIRSAMGVAILLAVLVAGVLVISSGPLATFYGNQEIKKILLVMAGSFAVSPFGSLLLGLFRRHMQQREIFFIKISSALCHVIVAVSMACYGFGAVSLAWANFAGVLSFGVAATAFRPPNLPWLPSFRNMKAIFAFGGVATLGNAATMAGTNIPEMIIGKLMTLSAVGYFSRANGLVQLFTKLITSAVLPLALPYFANVRREGKKLTNSYLLGVSYVTVFAWPFFIVLLLLAYPIMRTLYGAQWDQSIPTVEFLCIAAAIASVSVFAGHAMVASNQVRKSTYSQMIVQPIRIGVVFIAARYSLEAIAVSLVFSECLALLVTVKYLSATIDVKAKDLLKSCSKSAMVAIVSAIVPFLVRMNWHDSPFQSWLQLLIGITGAAFGWAGSILLFKHPLGEHLRPILLSVSQKKFSRLSDRA